MWLPSFLTLPISLSLPSISLPANIQRRFLSYVLKRALGRFIIASGLDVERVQAQISQGLVELERLEINTEEINSFIPAGLPLSVTSGEVAKVTARVPFPNLWSDPLSLTVDSLTLEVAIAPRAKKASPAPHFPLNLDLTSSVTSAADDFVHDELDAFEGAELDRSIRESLILNQSDPFASDDVPGAFPPLGENPVETTTVLAGLVERVLARLECRVRNVRLRIRYEDEDRAGVLELRIGEIRYADETPEETPGPRKRVRVVSISNVGVYLLPLPPTPAPSPHVPRGLSRSSSMSSDASSDTASTQSSDSNTEYQDMIMSQAVFDLRQSNMTTASGMSVYHSMVDEDEPAESAPPVSPDIPRVPVPEPREPENPHASRGKSRSATPTPGAAETLLLSFGSEDIVVTMTTAAAYTVIEDRPGSPHLPLSPRLPPRTPSPVSPASLDIDVALGTIAAALLPPHAAFLLAVAQAAVGGPAPPKQPEVPAKVEPNVPQPRFSARVRVKGVYAAIVYDMSTPTEEYRTTLPQFFARPASVYLPIGHLRLRLEGIAANYEVPSFSPPMSPVKRDRKTKAPAPKPPSVSLVIADASLFEYLASAESESEDEPPGGTFPVLIFDANLPKQYDVAPGASWGTQPPQSRTPANLPSFPEFDSVDWRNAGVQKRSGEKAWRVRPKGKGILRSAVSPEPACPPAVTIKKDLSDKDAGAVDLLPVHIFLDLSLVERLLPVLRSLAPLIQTKSEPAPPPHVATVHAPRPMLSLRKPSSIIDDLDAQAHAAFRHKARGSSARTLLTLRCPMIRLNIRCPAPPNRRGSWGDGAHLRSGIVTLDVHGLNTTVTDTPTSARRPSTTTVDQPKGGINVEWQRMVFLFSRVPGGQQRQRKAEAVSDKRSTAFLVIGPLAPEADEAVLLPTVHVRSEIAPVTGLKTQSVTCRISSVQAQIRQSTVEGLQFFADDITHWLDGAFGDGSAPKPRDDLKMIGSRFFGSKASSSASSSAVDDDDDDAAAATLLRVMISECEVVLIVPKADVDPEAPDPERERILSLHASDVDVKLESNTADRQETSITLQAMDASLFHHASASSAPNRLFGRTTSLSFTGHTQPLLSLRFSSITHADRTKETGIRLSAAACGVFVTKDLEWVHDLRLYAKTPEGVFEDVVPSEVTRIHLLLTDLSVRVNTPTLPGALVAVANVLEVRTAIESDADDSQVDIGLSGIHLLAVDDLAATTDLASLQSGFAQSLDAWKRAGYVHLVEVEAADAQILRSLVPVETMLVDVLHAKVKVTACADSLASLGALAGDMAKLVPANEEPVVEKKRPVALDQTIDVFASVDLEAFGQAPDIVSGADMIEDDLPTNLDYLDHAARQHLSAPKVDKKTGESLRSWESTDDAEHISESHRATIKVFQPEAFADDAGYWDSLPVLKTGDETRMGRTRIRVQNCAVGVFLHDGYDWARTRKAIEDEIKAVRRRLEKIKQLLASGQKADASIEQANTLLFNSVFIGLPERDDMDSTQLMAAIDEELLDLGIEETATESSWQPLPKANTAFPSAPYRPKSQHIKLHGKRLTRSKRGQIEFALGGLRADIDLYGPEDATAARIHVAASSFEILDHIKTSTWKKFLTEMKSDSRGNVRETDADMVRLEVLTVRPNLPSTDEEIRLRAKILPLRLHVDQDALDFLKHFFAFSPPGAEVNDDEHEEAPPKAEPFFQFVEIFPVELKLDYKPKRVDYTALRQGKTIELMNFFHFDGAEMTLRHVTLSGVTGSTRLSDMLQDIWTPDVKANQLADVISGVSPIRSMVNVGSGVADLILLPIEQYRKDGRVARGVQRGTNSFVKSTALEMMKLGARLATGTQVVLERAEGVLGNQSDSVILETTEPSLDDELEDAMAEPSREKSRYANQPTNVREGLRGAYSSLSNNFNSAAQTILAVPMEVYERKGEDGPLTAVVRAVPIAVLKPMIGASEAVSKTLWGLRNTLDPEGRRETDDKYK